MSDARAILIAALMTGVFSLTGAAITGAVQLIQRSPTGGAEVEEGRCARLADRLLNLREAHPEIKARARAGGRGLPRLYSVEEAAACGYKADNIARMLSDRTLTDEEDEDE